MISDDNYRSDSDWEYFVKQQDNHIQYNNETENNNICTQLTATRRCESKTFCR